MDVLITLLAGAILGAAFVLLAFALRAYTLQILVVGLISAAAAYVWFALDAGESSTWLVIELVGIGIYGAMGLRGLRGSPWWLAAGWAFHPLWDIALHYVGPGDSFAPDWYALLCLSFDLVVAGYIAYRITRGWGSVSEPALRRKAL